MTASCPWIFLAGPALPRTLAVAAVAFLLAGTPAFAQVGYTPDSLFVALFENGDALIEYDLMIENPAAEQVRVSLFGDTINDLIVTDFEDMVVDFRAGASPGEIVLLPAGAQEIRISYITPDLVGKDRSVWTFALDSPVSLSLKMPSDSVVIDWGDINPDVFQVGGQTLLTFQPGNIQVSYIIGFLGTEEQANIAIRLAESSIREAENRYPDIVLVQAKKLRDDAVAAKDAGRFADAEKLAAQAGEQVDATVRDYEVAAAAIDGASAQIKQAKGEGRDTASASRLLEQAGDEFAAGNYASARDLAQQAVAAIGQVPLLPVVIGAAAAAAGAGAFFALRRRAAGRAGVYRPARPVAENARAAEPARPSEQGASDTGAAAMETLPGAPESRIDSALLARIVHRIIEERQHLRSEDRDVLQFLAEREGAAFESEVRTRFQLPKTTIWRLIKRLEREELVEIRKAGGQNLIKLRFEGRQP